MARFDLGEFAVKLSMVPALHLRHEDIGNDQIVGSLRKSCKPAFPFGAVVTHNPPTPASLQRSV